MSLLAVAADNVRMYTRPIRSCLYPFG